MTPSPSVRPLLPFTAVTLITLAGLIAAGCGGTSTDGTGSARRAKPGGACVMGSQPTPAEDGCNTCTCGAGAWACTEMACPASDGGSGSTCQPGATRPAADGCNSCTCMAGVWECTLRACPPAACNDGDTKKQDCNTCTCLNGVWGCTTKACVVPPICTNGDTKPDSCNTCTCVNGGWACTKRACPPAQCQDGQTMFDGCNNCSCAGGQWACTLHFCPPPAKDAGPAGKGCGGWLGNTCAANEYCAYTEGALCGATDASATCAPIPTACDLIYAPVCGCDGKTYGNDCEAALARTGVLSSGPCKS